MKDVILNYNLDNSINIEVKINLLNNKLKDFIDYVKMLIEKDK